MDIIRNCHIHSWVLNDFSKKWATCWLVLLNVFVLGAIQADVINIGLRAHSGNEKGMAQWQPTADYLSHQIPDHKFIIHPYESLQELSDAAGRGEFDFVLTNPSSYVEMELKFGAARILTLLNKRQNVPLNRFGSVIFTRRDHADIQNISDLKGKSLMAVSKRAFGGWRVAWYELKYAHNINPQTDLSALLFSGGIQEKVVLAVKDMEADAGVVRTDMLERMAASGEIDLNNFRILGERETERFPFKHTTRLYPEWPIAKFPHVSAELANEVAIKLMNMPPNDAAAIAGKYVGWTTPLNYKSVHDLLKSLQVGPYEGFGEVTIAEAIEQHLAGVLGFFVAVILILLISFIAFANLQKRRAAEQVSRKLEKKVMDRTSSLKRAYETLEIENANRETNTKRLQLFLQLNKDAHKLSDEDLLKRSLDIAIEVTNSKVGYLHFVNEDQQSLSLTTWNATDLDLCTANFETHYPIEEAGIWADSVRTRRAVVHNDYLAVENKPGYPEGHFHMLRHMGVPVMNGDSVRMVIGVGNKEEAYNNNDVGQLQMVANDVENSYMRRLAEMELEEQRRLSQKMEAIGQLTGGIAHDFNNMLGIVMGNLELTKMKLKDGDDVLRFIEGAHKGAIRSAKLTKKLLSFSRKESGEEKRVNVNNFIREVEDLIVKSITVSIQTTIQLGENIWPVKIDPGDLEDSLINLSLNARDAMPKGGELIIETTNKVLDKNYIKLNPQAEVGEYVMIMVSDTGHGMTPEICDQILEPFFTTKEEGKGTGLGLSMVYGFVQRSRGHLKIYSEVGVGTVVRIYLPRVHDEEDEEFKPSQITPPRGTETILVVDDEDDLVEVAVQYLESLGYKILTATSGKQALNVLEENGDIDLLFSDVIMPGGMDGYQLALEAHKAKPTLKVLMASGFTKKREEFIDGDYEYIKSLTTALLSKPYNHLELAEAVRKVLDGGS